MSESLKVFIDSLPIEDKELIHEVANNLLLDPTTFDDFISILMEKVDLTKVTSFTLLLKMSQIVVDNPAVETICNSSLNYIPTLVQLPSMFDEMYTFMRIVFELIDFFLYDTYTEEWFNKFINTFEGQDEATKVFNQMFLTISERLKAKKLSECMLLLRLTGNLLTNKSLRIILANDENYYTIFKNIFSQTTFATDSYQKSIEFFGNKPPGTVNENNKKHFEQCMTTYHEELVRIMKSMLLATTSVQTLQVIRTALGECQKISKSGFVYSRNKTDSRAEAFGFNLESVLLKLALINRDRWANVDPLTPYLPNTSSPFRDDSLTLSRIEIVDDEWDSLVKSSQDKQPAFVSRFFFFALEALEYCSGGLIRILRMISQRKHQMTEFLARPGALPQAVMMINKEKDALEANSSIIYLHLVHPAKINDFQTFSLCVLDYLLYIGGIREGEAIPEKPTLQFSHLPEYMLSSVVFYLTFLAQNSRIQRPLDILQRLVLLFANIDFINSPEIKAQIVDFFAIYSSDKNNAHLVYGINHIIDLMFPAVIKFFCSVQITGRDNQFWERFSYRISCTELIRFWLQFEDFQKGFLDNIDSQFFKDFVYYLVDDSMYFADQSITLFRQIYDMAGETDTETVSEVSLHRHNLSYWMSYCTKSLELIERLISFASPVFNVPIIQDEFPKIILCFTDLLINQPEKVSMTQKEINFDSWKMFSIIVKILTFCANEQSILVSLSSNPQYPPFPMFDKALSLYIKHSSSESSMIARGFQLFIDNIKSVYEKVEDEEIDTSDAPEVFFDEITFELMNEPMILPSGERMDKAALERALNDKGLNPFTQTPLTIEECQPDVELKTKIEEYKKKKMEEKRSNKSNP